MSLPARPRAFNNSPATFVGVAVGEEGGVGRRCADWPTCSFDGRRSVRTSAGACQRATNDAKDTKGEDMGGAAAEFTNKGFVKKFVVPSLLVLLVPTVALAESAFLEEFGRLVSHLCERLAGSDDGLPKVFRDSVVSNLTEFFERFRHLNVSSSQELDQLVERARQVVRGVEPKHLRDSQFGATRALPCGCEICENRRAANALHAGDSNRLDVASIDVDLRQIVASWGTLPNAIRRAMTALARSQELSVADNCI